VKTVAAKLGFVGVFRPHSLRITAATVLWNKGIDLERIKRITDHKSAAISNYMHQNADRMLETSNCVLNNKRNLEVTFQDEEAEADPIEQSANTKIETEHDALLPPAKSDKNKRKTDFNVSDGNLLKRIKTFVVAEKEIRITFEN